MSTTASSWATWLPWNATERLKKTTTSKQWRGGAESAKREYLWTWQADHSNQQTWCSLGVGDSWHSTIHFKFYDSYTKYNTDDYGLDDNDPFKRLDKKYLDLVEKYLCDKYEQMNSWSSRRLVKVAKGRGSSGLAKAKQQKWLWCLCLCKGRAHLTQCSIAIHTRSHSNDKKAYCYDVYLFGRVG